MDTIFVNCRNSETYDPHRLLINLLDRINLKTKDKYFVLANLSINYTRKNKKMSYKNN